MSPEYVKSNLYSATYYFGCYLNLLALDILIFKMELLYNPLRVVTIIK